MGQNGNDLKTDKNGNRTEIKREQNGITRPVVRTGDGNFFFMPTVCVGCKVWICTIHGLRCANHGFVLCTTIHGFRAQSMDRTYLRAQSTNLRTIHGFRAQSMDRTSIRAQSKNVQIIHGLRCTK